ncbi:MAG: IS200/IS605 family transposase [Pyrinomonadaceae bacterium]|nr:IS200/IS605 family transposase [Sphingobacteriaceae bacterium]
MSHSLHKIWIHAIWATKERQPWIISSVEKSMYDYMYKQFVECGCPVRIINGMPDHVHCLFLLNPQKSIAEVIKQVKGSTAHWVNKSDLTLDKFSWQTGYAAYSVSESQLEKVYLYLRNQKAHHQKLSFEKEYDDFGKLYQANG